MCIGVTTEEVLTITTFMFEVIKGDLNGIGM